MSDEYITELEAEIKELKENIEEALSCLGTGLQCPQPCEGCQCDVDMAIEALTRTGLLPAGIDYWPADVRAEFARKFLTR